VLRVEPSKRGTRIVLENPGITPDVVDALVRAGHRIRLVNPHDPTLEELYFAVRRSARDLGEVTIEEVMS
jgi:hypothetical protein